MRKIDSFAMGETGRRLVEEQEARLRRQSASDANPFLQLTPRWAASSGSCPAARMRKPHRPCDGTDEIAVRPDS